MAIFSRVGKLVEENIPRIKKAFLGAFDAIKERVTIAFVADRLEKRDVIGAIRGADLSLVAFRDLDVALAEAFEAGGIDCVDQIPALREPDGHKLAIRFDVRNPRAEAWLKERSSSLVTEIIDDQREAVRNHLVAGMEKGQSPRAVALDLVGRIHPQTGKREGGVLGLTASQEAWSRTYAAELAAGDVKALGRALRDKRFDRTVEKAIREGRPIPADMRAKMVAAYRARALRYRAETIARTEAMASLNQAQIEAMEQAIQAGQVQERFVTKVWKSASDVRVRDTHRALHNKSVGFRAAFVSPSGTMLRYPGDPNAPASEIVNCRCTMVLSVDHLAMAAD